MYTEIPAKIYRNNSPAPLPKRPNFWWQGDGGGGNYCVNSGIKVFFFHFGWLGRISAVLKFLDSEKIAIFGQKCAFFQNFSFKIWHVAPRISGQVCVCPSKRIQFDLIEHIWNNLSSKNFPDSHEFGQQNDKILKNSKTRIFVEFSVVFLWVFLVGRDSLSTFNDRRKSQCWR